jgi:hypothetical protein
MSASTFAVPCAHVYDPNVGKCGQTPAWHELVNAPHAYTADERSVEYAALKLREALEHAGMYVAGTHDLLKTCDARDPNVAKVREHYALCEAALQLADAAGITRATVATVSTEERKP